LNDESVTIRYRDTSEQVRVKISEVKNIISKAVSLNTILKEIM